MAVSFLLVVLILLNIYVWDGLAKKERQKLKKLRLLFAGKRTVAKEERTKTMNIAVFWNWSLEGLVKFAGFVFRYSGFESVYRKFNPIKTDTPLPTGFLWVLGIYVAFYGVVDQKHQYRLNYIEGRVNTVMTIIIAGAKNEGTINQLPKIQHLRSPRKPDILNPVSVLESFFGSGEINTETVDEVKLILQAMKGGLDHLNLSTVILSKADLSSADFSYTQLFKADLRETNLDATNFMGADLTQADLRGAKGLDVTQFHNVKTLYGAKMDPDLMQEVKKRFPQLLEKK